jgi:hypothetical protein
VRAVSESNMRVPPQVRGLEEFARTLAQLKTFM